MIPSGVRRLFRWLFHPPSSGFASVLLMSAPVLLSAAATIAVALYILPASTFPREWWLRWKNFLAPIGGAVLSLVVGIIFAALRQNTSSPMRANPRAYGVIKDRSINLDTKIQRLCCQTTANYAQLKDDGKTACEQARRHYAYLLRELAEPPDKAHQIDRGAWLLATGYVDLWEVLHDAEEALFLVDSTEEVIAAAVSDEMSLMGSHIPAYDELRAKLRLAVVELGGARYLHPLPPVPPDVPVDLTTDSGKAAVRLARMVLRDVRSAINEFRDNSRDGIVRTRNLLVQTGTATGLIAYALLALAILHEVDAEEILAAAAFYLVGGLVGLFNQLNSLSNAKAATVEDFGWARARLFFAPILSGLAGVGGVVVTAMLYASLSGPLCSLTYPTPTATAAAVAGSGTKCLANNGQGQIIPTVDSIFDLTKNPYGLVLAAVFGLAPSLLVSRLQSRADDYKNDLQSTSVPGTKASSSTS